MDEATYLRLSRSYPKARKVYHCAFCTTPIAIGEKHLKQVGIYDGDFESRRVHECCLYGECKHQGGGQD